MPWTQACSLTDLGPEEVIRFDHDSRTFAIFRNHQDAYFCSDGLCTHEEVHLCDGLVVGNTVECPKHASIFDFTTGEVDTPPACNNLRTYPTKLEDGRVMVDI